MQGSLLIVVVLPVVAKNSQCIWDAVGGMLHLQLDLVVVHFLLVLGLLDGKDAFLSIWLLWVCGQDHIVSDQGLFWLLASFI